MSIESVVLLVFWTLSVACWSFVLGAKFCQRHLDRQIEQWIDEQRERDAQDN